MAFKKHNYTSGALAAAGLALGGGALLLGGCAKPSTSASLASTTENVASAAGSPGPVRMVRVSYETGKASWRPDGTTGWTAATINQPIRQGAEVWLAPGSRLELQFDDGGTVRLGDGAVATVQSLYSDSKGEFTEVKLAAGTSTWHLKNKDSIYQVDAPCDSVKSAGPSDFRVDINPKANSLAVRKGHATITANGKETPIDPGQGTLLSSYDDPVEVKSVGPEDDWDHFNDNRDALLAEEPAHVPPDVGMVSGGLDRHGHWHQVEGAGWVWSPTEEAGWRPYHNGHWAWVDPYGWTWVSSDPWGWAPYHYGTWGHYGFGWGWAPGPAVQYWSPARVDFVESNGYVSWVPLAPEEVSYPAFTVGFGGDNWFASFSIGGSGVYEPDGRGICQPVAYPWSSYYGDSRRDGWDPQGWGQHDFARNTNQFIPRNAAFGAVGVSARGFAGNGRFDAVNGNATSTFQRGTQGGANREAFSGPVGVHPTRNSFSPDRAITSNSRPAAMDRALVRGSLPANISGGSFGRQVNGGARGNPVTAGNGARVPGAVSAARQSLGAGGRGVITTPRGPGGRTAAAGGGNGGNRVGNAGPIAARRTAGVAHTNTRQGTTRTAQTTRGRTQATGRTQRTTQTRNTTRKANTTRTRQATRNTNTTRTRQTTGAGKGRQTGGTGRQATGGQTNRGGGDTKGRQSGGGQTNRGGGARGGGQTNRGGGATRGRQTGGGPTKQSGGGAKGGGQSTKGANGKDKKKGGG